MIEELKKSMSGLNMEQHYKNVREVFVDCGIKEYFDNYVNHKFTSLEQALTIKIFIFKAKNLMLYYEGGLFHNLSTSEMKQLMLYGLFKIDNRTKKAQEPAVELLQRFHIALPEKRQVSDTVIENVFDLLLKDMTRNKRDVATITKDAALMELYFDDDSSKETIEFTIHNKMNSGYVDHSYSYPVAVDCIHDKLLIPLWSSRWAKLKAFNRNWPKLVAQSRKYFKEQNTVE